MRFKSKSRALIQPIAEILEKYQTLGYDLTVRQIHYQLVSKNIIKNTFENYKMLVSLLTDARMAGALDWGVIVDRNRNATRWRTWSTIPSFLESMAHQFNVDKWADQDKYVEVMVEKDALSGIIEPVCGPLGVAFTANKGYSSASAFYEAGKRFRRQAELGKELHLLYLGDHDPSGIDMTRDVGYRISLLGGDPIGKMLGDEARPLDIRVTRLALNIEQVRQFNPPENFAKGADSRSPAYISQFGDKCWELDAVEPTTLAELVKSSVVKLRDEAKWILAVERENALIDTIKKFAESFGNWEKRQKKNKQTKKTK